MLKRIGGGNMADHNAHTYFGQEVMKRLPRDLRSHCTADLPAFHLGLYGPDPLIFSFQTKKTSDKLHKQWRNVSLPALSKALRHGDATQRSFAAGYLLHLLLDDTAALLLGSAVVIAILVWIVLEKTRFGYELRATGNNKNAAKYCGMAEKRNIILTLVISGALAGMGAAMLYLTGYEQWQCSTSSVPGMGFNGIAAAFLGGLHPMGTILASFFIQHITAGGAYVDKSMYCAQISDLISAIIIYLCGFVLFMKYAMNSAIARREEKAILKERAAEKDEPPTDASEEKGGDQ